MSISQIIQQITENSLSELQESVDIECKLAGGKDGKGELPNSFWDSYSAFANTNGGVVILGVKEIKQNNTFEVSGIERVHQIKNDIFKTVNNKNKVSYNLLTDSNIFEWDIEGKTVLLVSVPRATRKQQPIFLDGNPFGNTFIRQHEGDFRLPDEQVKRLIAEQVKDSLDSDILPNFSLSDIDLTSLQTYRQRFTNFNPTSPWNDDDNQNFLTKIGGYGKNRETGEQGLTKAGILMFGQQQAISEVFPDYMLDYQERESDDVAIRWIDRLVPDGNWSGNLFDFYRRVSIKLTQDIKIPFKLKNGERQDDTPIHIAIREALVNSLVHADYSDRASVKIVKYPNSFYFRNPGLMRVPIEISLQGGESDCRNRNLHKMFRFIKAGEQAGSGIPNILAGWRACHWQLPSLYEKREPNYQTVLELSMNDLFPNDVMQYLENEYGKEFLALSTDERAILATIYLEGEANHQRLKTLLPNHPADITKMLQHLVKQGMLVSTGGRWAIYSLASDNSLAGSEISLAGNNPSYPNNDPSYPNNDPSYPNNESSYPNNDAKILEDTDLISVANPARRKKRLSNEQLRAIILQLCQHDFLSLATVSDLILRTNQTTQNHLTALVKEEKIAKKYPQNTHPSQAYRTTDEGLAYLKTLENNPQQDLLI